MSTAHSACVAWAEQQIRKTEPTTSIVTSLVKRRAWSTVWKLDTTEGRFYLKEAAPGFDVEAPLLTELCRWRPAAVVQVSAVDAARGWILTHDAGRMLHDAMFDDFDSGRTQLRSILLAYTEIQVASLHDDAPPLAAMLEDRSPAAVPHSFAMIIENEALLRAGGATADELGQRSCWIRSVEHMCADAEALHLPAAFEHGDLHTSNIMIAMDGTPRIADWGDACWAIPFHSLVICLDDVVGRHKIARDDPWLARLTADYFKVWRHCGYDIDFGRALAIVRGLGPVCEVLQWSRGIDRMPVEDRAVMAGHVVKSLRALSRSMQVCGRAI